MGVSHVGYPNTFGTYEYIKWCRKVGREPCVCTNARTGTPEEMSEWMVVPLRTDGMVRKMMKR